MNVVRMLTIAVVAMTFTGCSQPAAKTPTTVAAATTAVVHPQRKSLVRVVEQPGTIQPFEEARLFARVTGYVDKLHADIGQTIRAGQLLVEIAVPELEEEASQKVALVRQAAAKVDQSINALTAADATVGAAEAAVAEAKALSNRWESEAKRMEALVKDGVVDAQTRDETTNQWKAAQAKLLSTEAGVRKSLADRDKSKADVRAAEAHVAVAEADARRLAALLVFAKIRAPFDGVVTQRKANTGDLVQPSKSEWLFTVARTDPVRVVIAVPEADAPLVRDDTDVSLTIPSVPGPIAGKVARTSWSLEPGSRTLRTEIDLPNKDARFRPGTYVHGRISAKLPEAWTLPNSALVKFGDGVACFLVDGDKAIRTPVQVGRGDGHLTEIVKRQSAPATWTDWTGNEDVAARAAGLTDGQTVTIESK